MALDLHWARIRAFVGSLALLGETDSREYPLKVIPLVFTQYPRILRYLVSLQVIRILYLVLQEPKHGISNRATPFRQLSGLGGQK